MTDPAAPEPAAPPPTSLSARRRAGLVVRTPTAAGALMLIGGAVALGVGVTGREDLPPGASPVLTQGSAQAPAEATRASALPPSEPVGLEIPAIKVRSAVFDVGRGPDGSVEVARPGPWYDSASWYRYSPTPGEFGPTVIQGHLDSVAGLSVFARLGELAPGDAVHVHREDGLTVTYRVTGIKAVPKAQFPTTEVYGDLDHPGLRLITCGGGIDRATGTYRDNILVFAAYPESGPTPDGAPNAAHGPVPLPVTETPTPTPTRPVTAVGATSAPRTGR